MNKNQVFAFALVVAMLLVTGCEPDKITVEVPVSAIQKAKQGETVYLKARANGVSEIVPDDISKKKDQIRQVIEKNLGKGGRMSIKSKSDSGLSFSAQWKIPLFQDGHLPADGNSYPMWLVLTKESDRLTLVSNRQCLDAMNEQLDSVDFMMDKISELGMTDIVFDNDTDKEFRYTIYGAFINGDSKVSCTQKVAVGDESTVSFGRKSSDSIWHDTHPVVFLPTN